MRSIALLLAGALLLVACEDNASRPDTPPAASSSPSPDEPRQRELTEADLPLVHNKALGPSHDLVERALKDLKALGFWEALTGRLFIIDIESRIGRADVPEDKHLADAQLTGHVTPRGSGSLCSIMFFPTAMTDDLRRQDEFYSQGMLPEPAPSLRHFWVAILGHELAHCAPGAPGEPYAEKWEERVLDAAQKELPGG